MNAIDRLVNAGQSLWLDNITRDMLDDGSLAANIDTWKLTGLTSNPSIFAKAISASDAYADAIKAGIAQGQDNASIFVELALADLRRAADLFAAVHRRTEGVDGWVSMEVSPLLADDTQATIDSARQIFAQAKRQNLFIKIPGTEAGVPAIEEAIYHGVPVNVTLLFSSAQYTAVAEAYMRALERRHAQGLSLDVASVASVFISRWDVAVAEKVPANMRNQLGIAIAGEAHRVYRELLRSERWQKLAAAGAKAQRLLWASTGTKDPQASDTLYVEALAAPDTINTLPDKTLQAFADHGEVGALMPADDHQAQTRLAAFRAEGIDTEALAGQLQQDGAAAFVDSWHQLLASIEQYRH